MPSLETTIKNAIKAKLESLVPATLGEVQVDDFKLSNIFDRDIAKYPAAILTSATIEAEALTNRDNIRTLTFEIVILEKGENVADATQIEDLREKIFNVFDDDPSLGGTATGGVEPVLSPVEIITDRSRSFIVFSVIVKAKAVYTRA
jgi:hypothetical protein